MEKQIHPFEKAGLGKAPFRCVGCRENWFVMPGFGQKPGGTCDYCGTGILYEYVIKSSDGAEFVVGSDCVMKCDREYGVAPVAGFREERLKLARQKREVKEAGRRAAREAAYQAAKAQRIEDNRAAWLASHSELDAAIRAYAGPNKFVQSMLAAIEQWGGLSVGQAAAVERCLAREAAEREAIEKSQWVGEIGKRAEAKVKVVMLRELEPYRGVYPPQRRWLTKMVTEAGSVLVWFGSKGFKESDDYFPVKFTPKEFGEYQGVKQTIVQRVAEV